MDLAGNNKIAIFGGGCFWCTEAVFKMLNGVVSVAPGYAGGTKENPTYEEICKGQTGHAEVIKIEYNEEKISFRDLLTIFFATHDPTTQNRQGDDIGPQYRSIILYATDDRSSQAGFGLHAVVSQAHEPVWLKVSTQLKGEHPSYSSLTSQIMASHWYERYLMDMFGIEAVGHPDPRRLVHHENIPEKTYPLRKDFKWNTKLAHANVPYPMHHVEGEGIYEIPVGPIHAGIIEPGHFRFNVAGERIISFGV